MKLFIGALTLVIALVISAVAGFFSVIGLGHLFAGAFWPVVIMGSSLEVGKLVAASWLKANWRNANVPHKHRWLLLAQTLVLMLITSLGIYGYLAKGHLEQEASLPAVTLRIDQATRRITQINDERTRLEDRLKGLDQAVNVLLSNAKTAKETQAADRARQAQRKDRLDIAKQIAARDAEVNKLNDEIVPLRLQVSDVSAKLGPVKYVAQLFGWQDPNSAVQMVILMIMFVFDPLAVMLTLSGTIMIGEWMRERRAAMGHADLKGIALTDMAALFDGAKKRPATEVPPVPTHKDFTLPSDIDRLLSAPSPTLEPNPAPEEADERPFPVAADAAASAPTTNTMTNAAATASIDVAALSAAHEKSKADLANLQAKHDALVDTHGDLITAARAHRRTNDALKAQARDLQANLDAALDRISALSTAGASSADETAHMEATANAILHAMSLEAKVASLESALASAREQGPVYVPAVYGSVIPVSNTAASPSARLSDTSWGALGASWKPASHSLDLATIPAIKAADTALSAHEGPVAVTASFPGTITSFATPNTAPARTEILTNTTVVTDNQKASADFHAFSESMFKARDK